MERRCSLEVTINDRKGGCAGVTCRMKTSSTWSQADVGLRLPLVPPSSFATVSSAAGRRRTLHRTAVLLLTSGSSRLENQRREARLLAREAMSMEERALGNRTAHTAVAASTALRRRYLEHRQNWVTRT